MSEKWKKIADYECYEVSNLGRIKSLERRVESPGFSRLRKERILKGGLSGDNYMTICLTKDKCKKTHKVHQLVAIAFLNHTPCGHKLVVNHINFIKTDNRIENLEIVTNRENSNRKHIKSSSIYTGVSFYKPSKKWESSIVINGKKVKLGYFFNELDASEAYQKKLLTLK